MAREIHVVMFQESTGTRLGNNLRRNLELADGAIDKLVLVTARAGLAREAPAAAVWLIAPLDTDLFPRLQNPAVGSTLSIPDDLAQALKQQNSTHLLLFTRHRDEADFQFDRGSHAGSGTIEGVGFYVDPVFKVVNHAAGTTAAGFLATFANFRATLVDARTGVVLRTKAVRAYQLRSVASTRASVTNPWDALTTTQKIQILSRLIEQNVSDVLPEVLASP